jgi:hypothetical protein
VGSIYRFGLEEIKCFWKKGRFCDPPSAQAFKADLNGLCSLGDVGKLVTKARAAGDIATRPSTGEQFATRSRLCAEFTDEEIRPAIEHLEQLAAEFESCFSFDNRALEDGTSGYVTKSFAIRADSPSVCTAPIDWPNGERRLIKRDAPGVVLCLPSSHEYDGLRQEETGLRFCTVRELKKVGVDQSWVDRIIGVVKVD